MINVLLPKSVNSSLIDDHLFFGEKISKNGRNDTVLIMMIIIML